jgi:hypothetical protein
MISLIKYTKQANKKTKNSFIFSVFYHFPSFSSSSSFSKVISLHVSLEEGAVFLGMGGGWNFSSMSIKNFNFIIKLF